MSKLPVVFLVAAILWLNLESSGQEPRKPYIHSDVQQLLGQESRGAALRRILGRAQYRGPGKYTEENKKCDVRHVVMCPQPKGPPLFAVFVSGFFNRQMHTPKGHLILVASDGVIVRCYQGNNLADGVFADVNGDGIVERIEQMCYGWGEGTKVKVRELFVLPMTEEVVPSLRIAFDVDCEITGWRVIPAKGKNPARVQIGPKNTKTGEIEKVTGEWKWNAKLSAWVGPGGGPNQDFIRLPPVGHVGLKEFALVQTKLRKK